MNFAKVFCVKLSTQMATWNRYQQWILCMYHMATATISFFIKGQWIIHVLFGIANPKYYIYPWKQISPHKDNKRLIMGGDTNYRIPLRILITHTPRVDFYGNILLPTLYDPIYIILLWKKLNVNMFLLLSILK